MPNLPKEIEAARKIIGIYESKQITPVSGKLLTKQQLNQECKMCDLDGGIEWLLKYQWLSNGSEDKSYGITERGYQLKSNGNLDIRKTKILEAFGRSRLDNEKSEMYFFTLKDLQMVKDKLQKQELETEPGRMIISRIQELKDERDREHENKKRWKERRWDIGTKVIIGVLSGALGYFGEKIITYLTNN